MMARACAHLLWRQESPQGEASDPRVGERSALPHLGAALSIVFESPIFVGRAPAQDRGSASHYHTARYGSVSHTPRYTEQRVLSHIHTRGYTRPKSHAHRSAMGERGRRGAEGATGGFSSSLYRIGAVTHSWVARPTRPQVTTHH